MLKLDESQIKGTKDAFRAFIAGLALPCVYIPFIYWLSYYVNALSQIRSIPIYLIPIAWGIWNVVQLWSSEITLKKFRLGAFGAILGLTIASIAESAFNIHNIIGTPPFLPLLMAPVVYFIVWEYILKHVNKLVGLEE